MKETRPRDEPADQIDRAVEVSLLVVKYVSVHMHKNGPWPVVVAVVARKVQATQKQTDFRVLDSQQNNCAIRPRLTIEDPNLIKFCVEVVAVMIPFPNRHSHH